MLGGTHDPMVSACHACIQACDAAISEFQQVPAPDAALRHCIESCRAARKICASIEELPYASGFAIRLCRVGAVICRACADECGAYTSEAARACAAACRQCVTHFHALAVGGIQRAKSMSGEKPITRASQRARLSMRSSP